MPDTSLAKYHALGNDYIVVDPAKADIALNKQNIKLLCDRHFGLGSDGILYGPLETAVSGVFCKFRIFNPDGSEAEKSGNGIRIFFKYLLDAGYIQGTNSFRLETKGGIVQARLIRKEGGIIEVDMGKISFSSADIPLAGKKREVISEPLKIDGKLYNITCVSIGNPHCVIIAKETSKDVICKIGPLIENNPVFPNRINVQLVKIINDKTIKIEIWERGAGYTLASGSSSCAAAAAAYKLGYVGNKIKVIMPGGELKITIMENNHALLRGSVNFVYQGILGGEIKRILSELAHIY
ncbi:MAG: diaminopimelate epimerase [Elusimicrobiota bacterium]|jgi:diaminopimelate epimerase|nr:diaminopimelate epimerase [Elusimicrobiota bacterium]